jgi:hypothetical protein
MAKKTAADLPLPEELLDKSIGLLEGPLNGLLERALKSRLVLFPLGLSQKLLWRSLGLLLGRPSSSSSSPKTRQER